MLSFWYEAKMFVKHSTEIEEGTLHVLVGVLIWLVFAMLSRRRVSSWLPWFGLLAVIVLNEVVDLGAEPWPDRSMQYGESASDLILTMLLPTVILLAVRWRPEMFVGKAR